MGHLNIGVCLTARWARRIAIVALFVIGAGLPLSAAGVTITVHAQPEGASVFQGGRLLGVTPLALTYPTPRRWKHCLTLAALSVAWMSGAKATLDTIQSCPQNTRNQQLVFLRPATWPDLPIDLEWAFKMAQLSIEQARLAAVQAATDPPYVWQPAPIITRPQRCISTLMGTQIITNCY